jgi:hypothetical protein
LLHGSLLSGIPCSFIAIFNLMWFNKMADQLTKTPAEVRSTSHQNAVRAPSLKLMKLRSMNTQNSKTHMYGVPQRVVFRNILGACPFNAKPYLEYISIYVTGKGRC